jgi:muramoyltetrapeptide carboxypeptidase
VIKPRALKPGDRVAIVSPASAVERGEFERGVAEIRRLGYEPVYDEAVFAREMFTSGSAAVRAEAFVRAWSDPGVAALVAARGGYGSVQMLPLFEAWRPQRTPKLFIGYSDTTSILSWLTCQCGITALHGPMIEGRLARGAEGYDEASFVRMLDGGGAGVVLRPPSVAAVRAGDAVGPLFGGTLTQLVGSLGTPYAFDPPEGSVLFIEDVNERPFRLDRMLTQLRLSGRLRKARALVFGDMRGCDEPSGRPSAGDVIAALAAEFDGPVLSGFPSGHTAGPFWTLPLGVRVRVTSGPPAAIVVEESPVV